MCRVGTTIDFEGRFQVSDDKDFHQLHEVAIKKLSNGGGGLITAGHNSASVGHGGPGRVCVTVRFLVGEAGQLRREQNLLFKNVIEVRKLDLILIL